MWRIIILSAILFELVSAPKVDQLRESITKDDQRAFIKCHILLGDTAAEIYHMLEKIAKSNAYSYRNVVTLYNEYKSGERSETELRHSSGGPRTQSTQENLDKLSDLLSEEDDWTEMELAQKLSISQPTISRMLTELGARKIASRWVPHELTVTNKQNRVDMCQENINNYGNDIDLWDRVIAIDESYLRSYDPKDAKSAKKWCLPGQTP